MGASHSHSHRAGDDEVRVGVLPRVILLVLLFAGLAATVVGVIALWPDGERVDRVQSSVPFAAPDATFPTATITAVQPACPTGSAGAAGSADATCGQIAVRVDEGADEGVEAQVAVPPEVSNAGLQPGDRLELLRTPSGDGTPAQLSYFGIERTSGLWLVVALFVVVVLAVARLRGLFALLGLGFAGAVFFVFVLPALLTGENPLAVGVVGSAAILYVVLYLTHGLSTRTSAALAGTLAGLGVTAALAHWTVGLAHLTGVVDEGGGLLTTFAGGISFSGLMTCAIIVAGLGVLNDVTITQASSVWELRAASASMTRRRIFGSAMRIGRDHIASTIYTIVFAYAGTALTVLLVIQLYDRPVLDLLGTEEIAEEIVRSLVSSVGLVLAVPLTTLIATLTVPGPRVDSPERQGLSRRFSRPG